MITAITVIFLLHVIGFLYAFKAQSDHFTDLIYALSFALIAGIVIAQNPFQGAAHWVLLTMIVVWAIRLGLYLAFRIRVWGRDKRFDVFRSEWHRLIKFWILQFFSIIIIALPYMFALEAGNSESPGLETLHFVGLAVWVLGIVLETVADYQKFVFKQTEKGGQTFITTGVWKYSRHPNYLGEWLCWVGVFIFSIPFLHGWEWASIISPIWLFILLRYVSGGNLLEKSADKKYGGQPEYEDYKKKTGIFFPKIA